MLDEHVEDRHTESPSEAAPPRAGSVLDTRAGRFVTGLSHILAIAQVIGLVILFGALLTYHTSVSSDIEGAGLSNDYQDITTEAQVMVGPWILGIPFLFGAIASVAWGLWKVRAWARRLALVLAFLMVVVGVSITLLMSEQINQNFEAQNSIAAMVSKSELDQLGEEQNTDFAFMVMNTATGLAAFYVALMVGLVVPPVGFVFRAHEAELRSTERRFRIGSGKRDHFAVAHEVEQI